MRATKKGGRLRKVNYTLAALTAVLGACFMAPGVASATSNAYFFCNTDQAGGVLCADQPSPSSGDRISMVLSGDESHNSAYFYPTNAKSDGQIRQYGTNLCLRQDNAAGNPNVILYPCQGMVSEEWKPSSTYIISNVTGNEILVWSFQNVDTKGCLNDDYYTGYLNVASCNDGPDQYFLPEEDLYV